MSINTVPAGIIAILVAQNTPRSLGLKTMEDPPPSMLDAIHLPAAYVLTSQASDIPEADDMYIETRVFRLQVAVVTRGDATAEVRETRVRPIIGKIKNLLRGYQNLRLDFVRNTRVLGDSGIVVLPEYGARFVGFEIRLEVSEIVERTWRD